VLKYGAQMTDALDKAHRHGVVHRDLRPDHVMLTKSGIKLLDFGLAKPVVGEWAWLRLALPP
jgi:eukaryotic-like serine/threonine-protein kinase